MMNEITRLLYIGKSNKRFTYNKTYKFSQITSQITKKSYVFVYYNDSQIMTIKDKNYFDKNFKLITDNEYDKLIRKLKLKKILKNEGFF